MNPYTSETPQYRAYGIGVTHGAQRGSWVFDGNTHAERYREVLRWIDDGDPRLDEVGPPSSPLAGEWADDFSLDQLAGATGTTSGDELDEVALAYEDGFVAGWMDKVETTARRQVGESVG